MSEKNIPLYIVCENEFEEFSKQLDEFENSYLKSIGFSAKSKEIAKMPSKNGKIFKIIYGMGKEFNSQNFGIIGRAFDEGKYILETKITTQNANDAILYFELGKYFYDTFKTSPRKNIELIIPNANNEWGKKFANIINKGRDLVNSPTNILGPDALAQKIIETGKENNCQIEIIKGDDLLNQNYPLIHAVGRASSQKPRLVILRKPKANAPKIGIIGKGVVFDTGGLNIKAGNFMGLMKKDMGGSACALTLFRLLLEQDFNIDLNLYVPIVENSIAGDAMRPSDVVKSRKGLSVEIDNTDAEGRLILADALTRASEDKMDFMVDFATLTGAARVALGPDLPPFYSNSDKLIDEIKNAATKVNDPVWNMPLWENYNDDLDSSIADMKNGGGAFAGSMTAALFLKKFVECDEWVHFDVYCWNPKEKPIGPMGGEIQAVRTMFEVIQNRYS